MIILLCIVRITSPELPPMAELYTGHIIQTETCDNDTALPLVEVLVTLRVTSEASRAETP